MKNHLYLSQIKLKIKQSKEENKMLVFNSHKES